MYKKIEGFKMDVDTQMLFNKLGNKSKVIRELNSQGLKRKEIAERLNIRYQHVRNVLITPIKG